VRYEFAYRTLLLSYDLLRLLPEAAGKTFKAQVAGGHK